ncbi:hypothetical protein DQ04_05001020 [Trypanosoma grayi]|uniref:hypothetical protein n=1 Tax=Trypanosoma grayi TaxID=71804 RepID=UPI0004F46FCB|nr:hypothetical protein DQ04_05001020 [Trypanosoma grayi]KEG09577.1 hypothetical protein DQ04_05001020 [Trypanosoma grayi]
MPAGVWVLEQPLSAAKEECAAQSAADTEGSRDGASSSRDSGSISSPVCERCSRRLDTVPIGEGGDPDTAVYISIIHNLQERVQTLQNALLSACECAALSENVEQVESHSVACPGLQQKPVFGEGQITRRRRSEWTQAADANGAMVMLEKLSSEFHQGDFEEWMTSASFVFPGKEGTSVSNGTAAQRSGSEEVDVAEEAPIFHSPKCDDRAKMPANADLPVEPIIFVDITAVMGGKNQAEPTAELSSHGVQLQPKQIEEEHIHQLTTENAKLREEFDEAQRQLDIRGNEMRCQSLKLEELSNSMEHLQQCQAKLQEELAVAHRQHEAAIEAVRVSEEKKAVAMVESLKADAVKLQEACTEAKHDAEVAWLEVRRLELELRAWGDKERELQRLRILMRFSELKKDSDQLGSIVEKMEAADKEKEQLREENRRCRTLLAEYRCRLDAALVHCGSDDINDTSTNKINNNNNNNNNNNSSSSSSSRIKKKDKNKKGNRDTCEPVVCGDTAHMTRPCVSSEAPRRPTRPASAQRVTSCVLQRVSLLHARPRRASAGRPPLDPAVFRSHRSVSRSLLFEGERGGTQHRQQTAVSLRSKSRPRSLPVA